MANRYYNSFPRDNDRRLAAQAPDPKKPLKTKTKTKKYKLPIRLETVSNAFYHNETDPSVTTGLSTILVSMYSIESLIHLSCLDLEPGQLVLLPHYVKDGDTQCSVTGKCKKGETPKQGGLRETLEELGLHARPEKLELFRTIQRKTWLPEGQQETWHYFHLHITSESCADPTTPEGEELYNACALSGTEEDNFSQRVCVFVTFNLDGPTGPTTTLITGRKRLPTKKTHDTGGERVVGMRVDELLEGTEQETMEAEAEHEAEVAKAANAAKAAEAAAKGAEAATKAAEAGTSQTKLASLAEQAATNPNSWRNRVSQDSSQAARPDSSRARQPSNQAARPSSGSSWRKDVG